MNRLRIQAALGGVFLGALVAAVPQGRAAEESATPPARRSLHLPATPYRYADVELPAHFKTDAVRRADNTPKDNPVTDAGAALGRVLFYDTRLSANNTTACASCHSQKHAFASPHRFNVGFAGHQLDRNSMSLVNLRYYGRGRFFWDERARSLEEQVLMPIKSKTELGQDLPRLVQTLAADPAYRELFQKAFGDSQVTPERMARALAQFLRSMVSYQSRFDEGLARARSVRADFANFTAQENRGKTLFLRNCATCHMPRGREALLFMTRPLNNGLDADPRGTDGGVGDVSLRGGDVGRFKSPSLRNVEYTAPYMHDGRFATLEEVVDHYSKGVKSHPNLDRRLRRRRELDDSQKAALVAFLKTLSDPKFISDPKFSDPFRENDPRPGRPRPFASGLTVDQVVARVMAFDGNKDGVLDKEEVKKLAEGLLRDSPPGRVGVAADHFVERVMAFDRNKDGKVTADELPERMQHLVAQGDTNKDGALDREEVKKLAGRLANDDVFRGFRGRRGRGFGPPLTTDRLVERLLAFDANKDGRLDREEVKQLATRLTNEALFADFGGRRGRGRGRGFGFGPGLSADRIAARIMAYDNNNDGKVTREELPERMRHLIVLGDANKDGVLDKEEVKKLAERLARERPLLAFGGPPGPRGRGR